MQGPNWSPEGIQRFAILASCYSGLALVRVPWWALLLVVFLASGQMVALAAVGCGLLICVIAGGSVVPTRSAAVAFASGLAVVQMVIACTAWIPVHYTGLYWLLAGGFLVWQKRSVRDLWARMELPSAGWQWHVLCFVLVCQLVVATKPEVSADGLSMHMAILDILRHEHSWTFDVTRYSWAVMPMAGDWSFAPAYVMGGEQAARWWNWLCLCGVCGLVFELLRERLEAGRALLLTAIFASTPLVQLATGSLLVENPWALFLAGGLYCAWQRESRGAAMLLGSACAAKFGSWLPAVAILLFLPFSRSTIAWFLAFSAPPYLTAWFRTGNPIFPFANGVFQSQLFDTASSFVEHRFQERLSWDALYRLTVESHRFFEGLDGALGFQYLFLVPLAILFVRRFRRLEWLSVAAIAACVAGLLVSQRNLRYLYPALPAASVLAGFGLRSGVKWVDVLLSGLLAANLAFLPNSGWHHRDFLTLPWQAGAYRDQQAPVRALIEYLNEQHPGVPVVFVVSGQTAGLRARAFVNSWHQYPFHARALACKNGDDWRALLSSVGAGFIVGPAGEASDAGLRDYLARFATPVMTVGDCRLFAVSR